MADDAPATMTTAATAKKVVHWQEVQDTVSRLASHKGVLAISILNAKGNIVTHHVTTAGAERSSKSSGGSSGTATNAAPSILGNSHLLTRMMKTANQYVQSLSGPQQQDEHETNDDDDNDEHEYESEYDDNARSAGASPSSSDQEEISFVRIRTRKDEILVAPKLGYTLVVLQDPSISAL